MYNFQANTARYIYTISLFDSANTSELLKDPNKPIARLRNGFIFTKEARSDEKIRYTETDLMQIIRTILFLYVFNVKIKTSIVDIINTGEIEYEDLQFDALKSINPLTINIASQLLNKFFGDNFSFVVRRCILKCYVEYMKIWRFYPYINNCLLPSADDVIKVMRFINTPIDRYTPATLFIVNNSTDKKIPFQNNTKNLSKF